MRRRGRPLVPTREGLVPLMIYVRLLYAICRQLQAFSGQRTLEKGDGSEYNVLRIKYKVRMPEASVHWQAFMSERIPRITFTAP